MYWQITTRHNQHVTRLLSLHYALYSRVVDPYPHSESLTLLGQGNDALLILSRPKAFERLAWKVGYDHWTLSAFRNESGRLASELVKQGLAAALYLWGDILPRDGVITLVDIEHLRPVYRRGLRQYGMCFQRVGFIPEHDDRRLLRRLTLSREALVQIAPVAPLGMVKQPVLL